jgi:hypothetical protein
MRRALTVRHKGFVNGTAALDYLTDNYPHAAQVLVVGKTIGSVASPVYGGLVADRLPGARVKVFGAQSGAFLMTLLSTPGCSGTCGVPMTRCPPGKSTRA